MRNLLEEGSSIFEVSNDAMMLDYAFSYSQFLINEQFDDRMLFLHTLNKDTKLLEAGQLISLNEGFISSIVEFLKKIVDSIASVVDRFISDIRKAIGMDSKFLAANKDKIRNGGVIENGDYWEQMYAFQQAQEYITSTDRMGFKQKTFDDFKNNMDRWQTIPEYINSDHPVANITLDKDENISYKDKIIRELCGDKKRITDKEIDLNLRRRMYDFCYTDYNKVLEAIKSDKEAINKVNDSVTEALNAMKRDEEAAQREKEAAQANTPPATLGTTGTETVTNKQEAALVSTMAYYFNEADEKDTTPKEGDGKLVSAEKPTNQAQVTGNENDNLSEHQKIANALKSFYNANTQVISARMKLCTIMYKQYMKIMRWYVSKYDEEKHGGAINVTDKDKDVDTKIKRL